MYFLSAIRTLTFIFSFIVYFHEICVESKETEGKVGKLKILKNY